MRLNSLFVLEGQGLDQHIIHLAIIFVVFDIIDEIVLTKLKWYAISKNNCTSAVGDHEFIHLNTKARCTMIRQMLERQIVTELLAL